MLIADTLRAWHMTSFFRSTMPRRLQAAALALALFVSCLALYTRSNSFPFYYHVDEASKARQVVEEYRNFWHPLLLITSTDLTMKILRVSPTRQNAVLVGRWWSAAFMAAAVVAFAM